MKQVLIRAAYGGEYGEAMQVYTAILNEAKVPASRHPSAAHWEPPSNNLGSTKTTRVASMELFLPTIKTPMVVLLSALRKRRR